jgi:exopolysaccharide biosynthesis polyprenyl glycosylphosphotransferase
VTAQGAAWTSKAVAQAQAAALRRSLNSLPKRRGWLVRRTLVVADVVGLTLAFTSAQWLGFQGEHDSGHWTRASELLFLVLLLPLWVFLADAYGLYSRDEERTDHSTPDDLVGVFQLVTLAIWVFLVGATLSRAASPPISRMVLFWALAIVTITAARGVARILCRRSVTYLQNTVIVGAGGVGQSIARKFQQHREYGINLIGFVDSSPRARRPGLDGVPLLGGPDQLLQIVHRFSVDRVVFAYSNDPPNLTLELIRSLRDCDTQIDIVPRLYEIITSGAPIFTVEGLPLVGLRPFRLSRRAQVTKRAVDVVGSVAALVVLAPLFGIVALAIRRESHGPVFFRQMRVGTGGSTFAIFKFRTMVADADKRKSEVAHMNRHARAGGDPRMFKIDDDPRTTRVGRFLRKYSLDELAQLINVLRGEMSLVGPRPLIAEEAEHVKDWGRARLDLKPGITGLWQVHGRSAIPFEEMVRLDYLYVTTWSVWTDFLIMMRTLAVVARGAHD